MELLRCIMQDAAHIDQKLAVLMDMADIDSTVVPISVIGGS